MTSIEPQAEVSKTFFEKLLSFVDNKQDQIEEIKNCCSETRLCNDDQKCISCCKELSKKWIISTLSLFDDKTQSKEEIRLLKRQEKIRFLNLLKDCSTECDAQIYSYFLYFCGILFLLKEKEKEDKEYREALRKFFEPLIQDTTDSNRRLLFRFLTIYIDLVDPEKKNIGVFKDLKDCLTEDADGIILKAIKHEHELMEEILRLTPDRGKYRLETLIREVFPTIEREYILSTGENIIESIIHSGIARLYFIAGRESEHIAELAEALQPKTAFPHNSFALVQAAHLITKYRTALETLDEKKALDEEDERLNKLFNLLKTAHSAPKVKASSKDYLGASERLFNEVIKLIEKEGQFRKFEPFNYRIWFEALLGLAYVYSLKGLYDKAERKYNDAKDIIDKYISPNKDNKDNKDKEDNPDEYRLNNPSNLDEHYLKSILWLCRGRNRLDSGSPRSSNDAKNDFSGVLRNHKKAPKEIKDELAEIAARAHNNLGVYYLNEADYEKAQEEFKQAIDIDDTNAHARYNLGVLYHIKKEEPRALTLFRNASNLDPKFSEGRGALEKLGAMKRGSLGSDWYNWWFEDKQGKKGTIRIAGRRLSIRKIVGRVLIGLIIMAFVALAFDLYLHDFGHHLIDITTGSNMPSHDSDENAFLFIFGVCIILLTLPFINKLKVSDIEIELETAGFRPEGPTSVTAGFQFQEDYSIRLPFFFARFWY